MTDPQMITGTIADRRVFIGETELMPERSQDLVNHSPDGFMWGYSGSGPSQLALALLLELADNQRFALMFYQDFKRQVIAALPQEDFSIPIAEAKAWIQERIHSVI